MQAGVFPYRRYRDVAAALDWLERAFGFERTAVHERDGSILHAELRTGEGVIMVGPAGANDVQEDACEGIYLAVADVDAHYARACEAGGAVVREPNETDYGSREYAVRDPEGFVWDVGTYRPEPG